MDYVNVGFNIFQCLLVLFWCYWLFISLFGFWEPRALKSSPPVKKFLILIPAHNEEKVIGSLVENLLHMHYQKELYDIVVIADNCTDHTAQVVESLGGKVLEHTSHADEPKGKPHAIRYALEQIGCDLTAKYDAVAIFDADNLVSLNYLEEMNKHFLQGDRIVQCFLDSKNPEDNWVTLAYSTSFYYANRFFQLAKSRLGLSNFIGGTGFCVETKLLEEIGWTAKSLTEDLEFTIQSILKGEKVNWCHTTRVFDEKPESFKASCIQRLRWARGHWDVTFRYAHKLLLKGLFKWDIKSMDALFFLINQGKMVLSAITSFLLLFHFINQDTWVVSVVPWYVWLLFIGYYFMFVSYPIIVDIGERSLLKIVKSWLSVVILFYTNIPLYFWGFFTSKDKTWKRTEHSRNIGIDELAVKADAPTSKAVVEAAAASEVEVELTRT